MMAVMMVVSKGNMTVYRKLAECLVLGMDEMN